MARIEKSVEINALPREVWTMICRNQVPYWFDQIRRAHCTSKEKEGVGVTVHVCGEANGIKSEWDVEITEWSEYNRLAWRTIEGTLTGIGSLTLIPSYVGTKATFMIDYDLPYSILGKTVNKLRIYKTIEKNIEQGMQKLKVTLESQKRNTCNLQERASERRIPNERGISSFFKELVSVYLTTRKFFLRKAPTSQSSTGFPLRYRSMFWVARSAAIACGFRVAKQIIYNKLKKEVTM